MAAATGKGDLRGAAERIERGIELYGSGDLPGALTQFDEALKLHPGNPRARSYHAWIRGLIAGKNAVGGKKEDGLDEDAVRAVSEALEEKSSPGMLPSAISHQALPEIARDIADDHEQEPTIERRDVPPGILREPNAPAATHEGDSPWDPVPLTPSGSDRQPDPLHERQASNTKSTPRVTKPGEAPGATGKKPPSSSTLHGMPALSPRLLGPQKNKRVPEDRPESVTREFRGQTPTGPNLRPLDVPELTDEQIAGLLALDSPLIPEGRTTPQIELDRIDQFGAHLETEGRLIELDAQHTPTPLPQSPPSPGDARSRKNDTSPSGVESFGGNEFEPQQLTPTGIQPGGLRAVAPSSPEDDPYADLNLLPLEVPPDLGGPDEVEEGGTNPTNPFIRGPKMAAYTSYGSGGEPKLDELPQLPTNVRNKAPTEPGMTDPRKAQPQAGPLARAEAALAAGDFATALDASEAALQQSGAGAGELTTINRALFEQIYAAILGSPERTLIHGQATPDLDPRQAFLLSRIDGAMTVEDVLDVSGMPRTEAMRLLAVLARRGAVKLK